MTRMSEMFTGSGGIGLIKSTVLTGTGAFNLDRRTKLVRLFMVGGGGGGGSAGAWCGISTANSASISGAGGGAPGEVRAEEIFAEFFGGEAIPYACGAGGAGGAGSVYIGQGGGNGGINGLPGSAGGLTIFGPFRAAGGNGGGAGAGGGIYPSSLGGQTILLKPRLELAALNITHNPPRGGNGTSSGPGGNPTSSYEGISAGGGAASAGTAQTRMDPAALASNYKAYPGGADGAGRAAASGNHTVGPLATNGANGGDGVPYGFAAGGGGGSGGIACMSTAEASDANGGDKTGGDGGNGGLWGGGGGAGGLAQSNRREQTSPVVTLKGGKGGDGGNGAIFIVELG